MEYILFYLRYILFALKTIAQKTVRFDVLQCMCSRRHAVRKYIIQRDFLRINSPLQTKFNEETNLNLFHIQFKKLIKQHIYEQIIFAVVYQHGFLNFFVFELIFSIYIGNKISRQK